MTFNQLCMRNVSVYRSCTKHTYSLSMCNKEATPMMASISAHSANNLCRKGKSVFWVESQEVDRVTNSVPRSSLTATGRRQEGNSEEHRGTSMCFDTDASSKDGRLTIRGEHGGAPTGPAHVHVNHQPRLSGAPLSLSSHPASYRATGSAARKTGHVEARTRRPLREARPHGDPDRAAGRARAPPGFGPGALAAGPGAPAIPIQATSAARGAPATTVGASVVCGPWRRSQGPRAGSATTGESRQPACCDGCRTSSR